MHTLLVTILAATVAASGTAFATDQQTSDWRKTIIPEMPFVVSGIKWAGFEQDGCVLWLAVDTKNDKWRRAHREVICPYINTRSGREDVTIMVNYSAHGSFFPFLELTCALNGPPEGEPGHQPMTRPLDPNDPLTPLGLAPPPPMCRQR